MDKYELIVVVNAQLPQEEKNTICKECCDGVLKSEARVINSQVWLEKQRFTFPIKRCTEGTYYLINLEGAAQAVGKLKNALRLNEKILRSALFKVDA